MTQHAAVNAEDWDEADEVVLLFRSNEGDEFRAYGPVSKGDYESKVVGWWTEVFKQKLEHGDVIPVPLFDVPPVW